MKIEKSKEFKTIKIPEETYNSLKELKKVIIQKGLSSFSNNFINYIDL